MQKDSPENQLTPDQMEHQARVFGLAALWAANDLDTFDMAMGTVTDSETATELLSAAQGVLGSFYVMAELETPPEVTQKAPEGFDALRYALADTVGGIVVMAKTLWKKGAPDMLRQMAYRATYEAAGKHFE